VREGVVIMAFSFHAEKVKSKQTLINYCKHNFRTAKKYSNQDINLHMSKNNMVLHTHNNQDILKVLDDRLNLVHDKIRDDAVLCLDFIVSADKEFFDTLTIDEQKQYFKNSLDFLNEKFGADNLLYAVVHFDETTPHMHIAYVPLLVKQRKGKDIFCLSAKEFLTPIILKNIQSDMPKFLNSKKFNVKRGREHSKAKHKTVVELKLEAQEQNEIKKALNNAFQRELEQEKARTERLNAELQQQLQIAEQRNLTLSNSVLDLQREKARTERLYEQLQQELRQATDKDKDLFRKQGDELVATARGLHELNERIQVNKGMIASILEVIANVLYHSKLIDTEQFNAIIERVDELVGYVLSRIFGNGKNMNK
jgi:hypothetical protein